MKVKVLYHDNCFDGACSAAVFSRFYRQAFDAQAEFTYHGLTHKPGKMFDDDVFDADIHAIVDFKYNSHENLTWWFDHHQSAFLCPEDEGHFRADHSGRKFYDPYYKSCTKFIADIAREKFNCPMPELADMIAWADLIDGAQYETAENAISLKSPATQIALVIESGRDAALLHHIITLLQDHSLAEVAGDARVQAVFQPLLERHNQAVDIIRNAGECSNGVVLFDVSEHDIEGYNKFIAYCLFPQARYSVGVSRGKLRSKVSIGYNPWNGQDRTHNLANICERYGGGGHAVVGAISYAPEDIEKARQTAREVAHELRTT
ncbi:MAG: phosphoesterase [Blastocatellia bacterium]|nr:phosphoesterase [Blastocatellia bacterium]